MIQNTITILYRQFNKFHICILTNQRTKDEENKKKETILSSLFEKKKKKNSLDQRAWATDSILGQIFSQKRAPSKPFHPAKIQKACTAKPHRANIRSTL